MFAVDNDYLARDKDGQFRNWGAAYGGQVGAGIYREGISVRRPSSPIWNDFNTDLVEQRKRPLRGGFRPPAYGGVGGGV